MHLVERYALSCGVKIGEPFIYSKFFPLLVDKYITIHTTSKGSKTYDFWQEVVDILLPTLNKAGIAIVQIGGKEDKPLSSIYSVVGQTNINQTAYVIERAMLHLGVDSFPAHVAGYHNKRLVALYSNIYANCARPYWGDREKQILLEPDRKGNKPSFSNDEFPKTINTIKPEIIANHVCKLLGLESEYKYESLFHGDNYGVLLLESVPNGVVNPRQHGTDNMVVRMDFLFNEEVLAQQLGVSKCTIVTDKAINPNLLLRFKDNITDIHYEVTRDNNPKFIEFAIRIGIKVHLFSYLSDAELESIKLSYMDFGIIHRQNAEQPEELKTANPAKIYYKSNKFTISNGKIYASHRDLVIDNPIPALGNHLVKLGTENLELIWKEKRHFRFVKEKCS